MVCSCCNFSEMADRQFTAEKAAKELNAYRKGRLGPTTRLLRDTIVELGLSEGSLLDIGGGVGALSFELLDRGITKGRWCMNRSSPAMIQPMPVTSRSCTTQACHADSSD